MLSDSNSTTCTFTAPPLHPREAPAAYLDAQMTGTGIIGTFTAPGPAAPCLKREITGTGTPNSPTAGGALAWVPWVPLVPGFPALPSFLRSLTFLSFCGLWLDTREAPAPCLDAKVTVTALYTLALHLLCTLLLSPFRLLRIGAVAVRPFRLWRISTTTARTSSWWPPPTILTASEYCLLLEHIG